MFAIASASPNIAVIKYWGNINHKLLIPSSGSISITLSGLFTKATVEYRPDLPSDTLTINSQSINGDQLHRATIFMDKVRRKIGVNYKANITTESNFPMGSGIASSASAFAAIAVAATAAANISYSKKELSILARQGSGSASRSIFGGFVEWYQGEDDRTSYALQIFPKDYWQISDCIVIVSTSPKSVSSLEGHHIAETSPLQKARVADTKRRIALCKDAIKNRNFDAFAEIVELDSNLMHAVMLTSKPPIIFWEPTTLKIMRTVRNMRMNGLPVCYTVDAGPNVHVLTEKYYETRVKKQLLEIKGVKQILLSEVGEGAKLIKSSWN